MAAQENPVPGGGLSSVSAHKRDMKGDGGKKKLTGLHIEVHKGGFTVRHSFHSKDPMSYARDETHAIGKRQDLVAHLKEAIPRLGKGDKDHYSPGVDDNIVWGS